MHHFEVLLRNLVDARLGHSQPDEPIDETWLRDGRVLTDKGLEEVDEALARLRQARAPQTRGRVVAALNFGFWRALSASRYEELWRHQLKFVFPGAKVRADVSEPLEKLHRFRNRLAHHDSILQVDVAGRFVQMVQIANWADTAAGIWLRDSSSILKVLGERPR